MFWGQVLSSEVACQLKPAISRESNSTYACQDANYGEFGLGNTLNFLEIPDGQDKVVDVPPPKNERTVFELHTG